MVTSETCLDERYMGVGRFRILGGGGGGGGGGGKV